jgi:hypothetical protein
MALSSLAPAQVAQKALANSNALTRTYKPPRAPDGHPDLQGIWSNNIATPLERPKELAGRATLTDEEVAAMKKKAHELFGGDGDAAFFDGCYSAVLANVLGTKQGYKSEGAGGYGSVWIVERDWENRTSLITDPADGRMPPLTPEAKRVRAE